MGTDRQHPRHAPISRASWIIQGLDTQAQPAELATPVALAIVTEALGVGGWDSWVPLAFIGERQAPSGWINQTGSSSADRAERRVKLTELFERRVPDGRRRVARIMVIDEDGDRNAFRHTRADDLGHLDQLGRPIDDGLVPGRRDLLDRLTIADQPDKSQAGR